MLDLELEQAGARTTRPKLKIKVFSSGNEFCPIKIILTLSGPYRDKV